MKVVFDCETHTHTQLHAVSFRFTGTNCRIDCANS